jgi:hypothetical protein
VKASWPSASRLRGRGIARERLVIDPGFGFGKSGQHNLALLRGLSALRELGVPVLAGLSRKSTLGTITGRGSEDRLAESRRPCWQSRAGAAIVRVTTGGDARCAAGAEGGRPTAPSEITQPRPDNDFGTDGVPAGSKFRLRLSW